VKGPIIGSMVIEMNDKRLVSLEQRREFLVV
jgi:hypothetical protein